ncbi:MAG: cysteine--tRNA ligase [Nitrososphaerota archaeon]|nr:cysteine--tRNA ligase [Nitrososphaerota archaeon]MDG7026251.1 cysteine--tRNA ligase [Nitrososphaerota archaeon]
MLRLFNSLGREMQEFRPIRDGEVRIYNCGPTVWNYAHVGNFRAFVFYDVLRRHLKFKGYKVTSVMNITDVEDKIIRAVGQTGKSLRELTEFYIAAFMEDLASLKIEKMEAMPRATEHLPEILRLVRTLVEKGYAYRTADGSVYFDVSKFKRYGALSGVRLDSLRPAGRVSSDHYEEKKEAADFALWKAWEPGDGDVFWESEFGRGRPGWSVECSAMSMNYLGETFDIHTGGADLKFPHHENEIAQSEAATGKKFVNYWLHSEFLNVSGREMHKSSGNLVTLRELLTLGWDPLTVRAFLVSGRYRDQVDLTEAALSQAKAQRGRLQELLARLRGVKGGTGEVPGAVGEFLAGFEAAMDDDLDTPRALAAMLTFTKEANAMIDSGEIGGAGAQAAMHALARADSVLGILKFGEDDLEPELAELVREREAARQRRDFAESDRLRAELLAAGVVVEDTPEGTRWKRVRGG